MAKTDLLMQRIITVLDYINKIESNPVIPIMKQNVENAYKKNNIRSLEVANRDINEWIKDLTEKQKQEIYSLLGEDSKNIDKTIIKNLNTILKNKKIKNEDEYRLVLDRVDELSQEENLDTEQISVLNGLLTDFDSAVQKKKNED